MASSFNAHTDIVKDEQPPSATPLRSAMKSTASDKKESPSKFLHIVGTLLRTILLELPVLILFALAAATCVVRIIGQEYLLPQLELQEWTPERGEAELTYYHRLCDESDQSAFDTPDLVVHESLSTKKKVEHMLRHGVSVYPNILSPETAHQVREFILRQNEKNEDMIEVIENKNRWSFGMRVDQDPSVTKALNEILTNPTLVTALEAIAGVDPAVIEFTGITSAYGAATQRWHQDVVPDGSAAKYARNFIPSYSLFIPLQNTTKAMGATDICPGTHMCAAGPISFCDKTGFAVSGSNDNWPLGWGALVNQQTTHRGAPHTDPNGPHRVLFIVTFAPRPQFDKFQVNTHMISTGGSYSLHWSQWGHTLRDFRDSAKRMWKPLRYFRTLGLYKPKSAHWGWDYISQVSARIANGEQGFFAGDLKVFLRQGGISFLPLWLQGTADEESEENVWVQYVKNTLDKLFNFFVEKYFIAALVYSMYVIGSNLVMLLTGRRTIRSTTIFRRVFTMTLGHILVWTACWICLYHTRNTSWAKNIKAGRQYTLSANSANNNLSYEPSVLALKQDILDLTDLQSECMASYNNIIDVAHPGNRAFRHMIKQHAPGFTSLSYALRMHFSSSVYDWTTRESRRILAKNVVGQWSILENANIFVYERLARASNNIVDGLMQKLSHLDNECTFGYFRDTALHKVWIGDHLYALRKKLLGLEKHKSVQVVGKPRTVDMMRRQQYKLTARPVLQTKFTRELGSGALPRYEGKEPFPGAWLQEGDIVEARYNNVFPEWYRGTVQAASADRGTWDIEYDDGDIDYGICPQCVREYKQFTVGERADVPDENMIYFPSVIEEVYPDDDTYSVRILENNQVLENVSGVSLRRFTEGGVIEPGSVVKVHNRYSGMIWNVNKENNTFDVLYDSSDYGANIPAQSVRLKRG